MPGAVRPTSRSCRPKTARRAFVRARLPAFRPSDLQVQDQLSCPLLAGPTGAISSGGWSRSREVNPAPGKAMRFVGKTGSLSNFAGKIDLVPLHRKSGKGAVIAHGRDDFAQLGHQGGGILAGRLVDSHRQRLAVHRVAEL